MKSYFLIFILCIVLAWGVGRINENTLLHEELSDQDRYYDMFTSGSPLSRPPLLVFSALTFVGKANFPILVNFLLYLSIGFLFWYATHDWIITLIALLGFSTTLITTNALYAQALVLIIALAFWIFRPPALYYIGLAILATFGHKFGIILAAMVYVCTQPMMANWMAFQKKWMLAIYVCLIVVCGMILLSGTKMTFFYPVLAISLGSMDTVFWFALFSLLFFTFYQNLKESDTDVLLMASLILIGAIANYFFLSKLEVDFWRILILFDWVALLYLGKIKSGMLMAWCPIILLLIGVARFVLGMHLL